MTNRDFNRRVNDWEKYYPLKDGLILMTMIATVCVAVVFLLAMFS